LTEEERLEMWEEIRLEEAEAQASGAENPYAKEEAEAEEAEAKANDGEVAVETSAAKPVIPPAKPLKGGKKGKTGKGRK
jgi:hypothetical protein